ncbi:hypothetical protein KCU83_g6827, partial [Aureobasidium melanogenum]
MESEADTDEEAVEDSEEDDQEGQGAEENDEGHSLPQEGPGSALQGFTRDQISEKLSRSLLVSTASGKEAARAHGRAVLGAGALERAVYFAACLSQPAIDTSWSHPKI